MKKLYLAISVVFVMCASANAFLAYKRIASDELRHALRTSGEVCVSYRGTWLGPQIDKHWHSRTAYGIEYCDDKDFPAGVTAKDIGQL